MAEEGSATQTGGRTDAASVIAELWAEREQGRSSPPPAQPPSSPSLRPRADGRQRALAVAITVLLIAGVLGVVAERLGIIGAPSKADFVAEADTVCGATNGGVNAISKPAGYPALATAASTLVTTTDTQLGRLRALDLPGGDDRGRARAVFSAMTATTDAGRNLQAAAGAGDASMTAAASRSLSASSQDAVAKARDFGFTACVAGMKPGIDAVVAGANGVVKNSFVEAGNRHCIEFLRAAEAVPPIRNANDVSRFINQSTGLLDKLVSDLKALTVAPGDESTVAELIAMFDNLSGQLKQLGVAGAAGDLRRMNAIQGEIEASEEEANAKFGAYGLTACGSPD